jgi:hypothetical protein
MQPVAKAIKAPAKKDESSSEEDEEDSDDEEVVRNVHHIFLQYVCYGNDLVTSLGSLEVALFWLEFRCIE